MKTDRALLLEAIGIINTMLMNAHKRPGTPPNTDRQLDWRAFHAGHEFVMNNHDLALEAEFPNAETRAKIKNYIADLEDDEDGSL